MFKPDDIVYHGHLKVKCMVLPYQGRFENNGGTFVEFLEEVPGLYDIGDAAEVSTEWLDLISIS